MIQIKSRPNSNETFLISFFVVADLLKVELSNNNSNN